MSSQQDLSYLVDLTGREYPLEPNKEFTIGRALSNSLTIEDLKISRTHCRLRELSGLWSIVDESANGMYVNEKRVPRNEPLVLSNGDAVKLADQVRFRFVEARSAVATDMEMSDVADQIETEHRHNPAADEVAKPSEVAAADPGEGSGTSRNTALRPDVETELQCSICTELFVKAKTLNCSHSFCAACIDEWRRKNEICPICRAGIKTVTPTIVLDNLVNAVIESSSDEVKRNRKLLLEERSKVVNKVAEPPGPHTRSRTAHATRATVEPDPVLVSSDNDTEWDDDGDLSLHAILSDSDEFVLDDDDDEDFQGYNTAEYEGPASYVPGDPHAYYGGYGSCFHCGARGHWANGCPFR